MFVSMSFATCIIFKFIFMSLGEGQQVKKKNMAQLEKFDP